MAKKNYQRLTVEWAPVVRSNNTSTATIEFRCVNSKGTEVDAHMRVDLYWLPELVREFTKLAKEQVKIAQEFERRLKASAE